MDLLNKEINSCYLITDKLNENDVYTSWKAKGLLSPLTFNLKFLNKKDSEYELEDLIRFEKQILGIYKINHPNIKRIFEIDKYNDYKYISLEFIDGISLTDYLVKKPKLEYKDALKIIFEICKGLEVAHRNGVIHKMLNPNNILLGLAGDKIEKIKISNFGFSELNFFNKKLNSEELKNSFYLPPEAFGYYNRSIDERSDLYSLGIIFCRLLLGELQFPSTSLDETFRKILSTDLSIPLRTLKKEVPAPVKEIIQKLISKNIEARYHSAIGLLTDLERLNNEEKSFELGIEDETFNPTYETNLVSLSKELSLLNNYYDSSVNGNGSICFIYGEYGFGKSKLIEEFSSNVYLNNGFLINGAYFSCSYKYSYYAFKRALDKYVYYFLKLNSDRQDKIKNELKKIMTPENKFIIKIFPAFNIILEFKTDELLDNKIIIPKNYLSELALFFCKLSKISGNLVLSLDNFQWIDEDSLYLLEELINHIDQYPILILVTCIQSEYIKIFSEDKIDLKNEKIKKIYLNVLDKKNIDEMILNILGKHSHKLKKDVFDFIYNSSGGNPSYSIEILKQLINDEIIYPVIDKWECDSERLNKYKALDINDIIVKRMQQLRNDEFEILSVIAILDVEIKIDILFKLCSYYYEDILTIVEDLIQNKFLYKKIYSNGNFICMNDMIKNLIRNKLYDGKIKALTLSIGNILEQDILYSTSETSLLIDKLYITAKSFLRSDNNYKSIEFSNKFGQVLKEISGFYESRNYLKNALELMANNYQKDDKIYLELEKIVDEITQFIQK